MRWCSQCCGTNERQTGKQTTKKEEREDWREAQTQTQNALTLWSEPRSTLRSKRERERERDRERERENDEDVVGVPEGFGQKERMLSPDTVRKSARIKPNMLLTEERRTEPSLVESLAEVHGHPGIVADKDPRQSHRFWLKEVHGRMVGVEVKTLL